MYLNFGKKNEVPGNYNKPFVLKSDNTSRGHFVEIEKMFRFSGGLNSI